MANLRDFSKMMPGPSRMLVSDVRWRPLTMDEQTLVGHTFRAFRVFADCTACPHSTEVDTAALVEAHHCAHQSIAWLKARLTCAECGSVGTVELRYEKRLMHRPDPNARPLGGHLGPKNHPHPGVELRISDWQRRRTRHKGWHKRYLDENGNPTRYSKDD